MVTQKNTLAMGYDRAAPLYDDLVGPAYAAGASRLLERFPIPPGAAILDVATGTGIALFEAVRRTKQPSIAVGVDISPNMVRQAQAKAAALGLPVHFMAADAERLPFADATFDVVLCSSAFHWFPNRFRAANEMNRVLKPGGRLLLVSASAPCGWEWMNAMAAAARIVLGRDDLLQLPNLPSPQEVAGTLSAAGFQIAFGNTVVNRTLLDPQRTTALMSLVVPDWAAKLDQATAARIADVAGELLSQNGPNSRPPYTWSAVELVGVKPAFR